MVETATKPQDLSHEERSKLLDLSTILHQDSIGFDPQKVCEASRLFFKKECGWDVSFFYPCNGKTFTVLNPSPSLQARLGNPIEEIESRLMQQVAESMEHLHLDIPNPQRNYLHNVLMPMVNGKKVGEGVVTVNGKREFSEQDVLRLKYAIKEIIIPTIKRCEKHEEEVSFDGRTGLHNYNHFEKNYEKVMTKCESDGKPIGVVMMDLDHFRKFNKYGHPVGDAVLSIFANILKKSTRESDSLARYKDKKYLSRYGEGKSDEFCMVLEGETEEQIRTAYTRIRQAISRGMEVWNNCAVKIRDPAILERDPDINEKLRNEKLSLTMALALSTNCGYRNLLHIADADILEQKERRKNPTYTS